jgi:hypothetical protein|tara:strand:- start:1024 stop:1314 length:291 start_codon:yes stop_codon:yes gene_type:complete
MVLELITCDVRRTSFLGVSVTLAPLPNSPASVVAAERYPFVGAHNGGAGKKTRKGYELEMTRAHAGCLVLKDLFIHGPQLSDGSAHHGIGKGDSGK